MDWLYDPTALVGLLTLVVLELVLGIDNLIFIAILAEKLPVSQRDKARRIGLLLALLMRVVLLFGMSWLVTLTSPLVTLGGVTFSGRDLILFIGGLFLLFKATNEIHVRLEGNGHGGVQGGYRPKFWMVVTQIVVLDAVFSIDAVITAVGMVEHLSVMVTAVTLAIALMLWLSKPITTFVNKHPTVVMLCLGFLLMVGFSLIAEGFGFHIPKGYLYAAIGFSILIEFFNQFSHVKLKRRVSHTPDMRARSTDAILKLLGAKKIEDEEQNAYEYTVLLQQAGKQDFFSAAEKDLLRGVLNLKERPVSAIMTPRTDLEWLDVSGHEDEVRRQILSSHRSTLLVSDEAVDDTIGVVSKEDILLRLVEGGSVLPVHGIVKEPLFVHESVSVLKMLELFKRTPTRLAVVLNEMGSVLGVLSHHDLLEAIGGEFPDHTDTDTHSEISQQADGSWVIDGGTSVIDVSDLTGFHCDAKGNYATLAGFVLHELGRMPKVGDTLTSGSWKLKVLKLEGNRIATVHLSALSVE